MVELIDIEGNLNGQKFSTILADPPWRFRNRTGKIAPENTKNKRYSTMSLNDIISLDIPELCEETAHLYLWIPNALLQEGLKVMKEWGFEYKTYIVWQKIRKDNELHKGGVGFYFRNNTELLLFGTKGKSPRTLKAGRTQINVIQSQKREHSRKPDEQYHIIENCSPGPYLELFARGPRKGWESWGNEAEEYFPHWSTYKNHSQENQPPLFI